MRVTSEHYKLFKQAVSDLKVNLYVTYHNYKTWYGFSDQRFIWDVFWATKLDIKQRPMIDQYLDTHIETATKKAINECLKDNKHDLKL